MQVGVVSVGTSSYFGSQGSAAQKVTPEQNLIGMGLIIISQVRALCCFSLSLPRLSEPSVHGRDCIGVLLQSGQHKRAAGEQKVTTWAATLHFPNRA